MNTTYHIKPLTMDEAEALFDITTVACDLLRQGRITDVDSRDLMRFCIGLAKDFTEEERDYNAGLTELLNQSKAIADEDIMVYRTGLFNASTALVNAIEAAIADDRDSYLDRVEEYAIRELTNYYWKEA